MENILQINRSFICNAEHFDLCIKYWQAVVIFKNLDFPDVLNVMMKTK